MHGPTAEAFHMCNRHAHATCDPVTDASTGGIVVSHAANQSDQAVGKHSAATRTDCKQNRRSHRYPRKSSISIMIFSLHS